MGAILVRFSHLAPAKDPMSQKVSSREASRFDDKNIKTEDRVFMAVERAMPESRSLDVDDCEPMLDKTTTIIAMAKAPIKAHTPIAFDPKILFMPRVMPRVAPKVAPELMPST